MEIPGVYRAAVSRETDAWDFMRDVWVERVTVPPDKAREWLANCKLDIQRPEDPAYVQSYARALTRGEFRLDAICMGHLDDRMYIVNGYHRLMACSVSCISLETAIIHFRARDMDHIKWMYVGLDGGKSRRLRDRIISAQLEDILHLKVSQLTAAAGAMKYIATGFKLRAPQEKKLESYLRSMDLPLIAVREWEDEILAYFKVFPKYGTAIKRGLMRQGIMAAFLALLRHRSDDAIKFLRRVAENDGLRRGEAAWALVEAFGKPQTRGDKGAAEESRRVAIAWNAYLSGRTLESIDLGVMRTNIPIRFDGTHYDGKQVYEEVFGVNS